jgi:hypothetical protein
MSASLENNPRVINELRRAAESPVTPWIAALLEVAADQLEHTHEIATAGWLETEQ